MKTKKAVEFLEKRDRIFLYGGSTQYMSELNKAIDQVVDSSKRGERFEKMWKEAKWEMKDLGTSGYFYVENLEQKYFPPEPKKGLTERKGRSI